ncbi:MAG TPA: CHAD domain-containing protein [Acidimicrobiales bacterium]|nr:CHAD domain-containing protein [Acidimicrobiales bacterium]
MSVSPEDVEVEWQFDALDLRPAERWFGALSTPRLGGISTLSDPGVTLSALTATARPAERLADTYFDTADWRIGRSGHVLRVRHRGGRAEVTLKGLAQSTAGLRRRLEVTEPLPADGVGALTGEGPVGWRLRALAGKRPLQVILEVRTRRRPYDLRVSDETVAEAALDETTISVGNDHQPVRLQRVEVEVEPGWVERLTPLVDTLRRECGLQSAALSKFEAGLLAAGLQVPPAPELGPVSFDPNPSVGDVAFAVIRRNFSAVLAHETGTRLGEDAEELHDMRVATRRTRAALSLFEEALPVRARHVRMELGWLAGALGAVRDLDVQLERLDAWTADVPDEERFGLADLAALLSRQRAEARRALLACLDSARYERMVAGFTSMLRQGPSRRSAAARAPAGVVVPDLIEARHRAATKAARRARRSGDIADFHITRIRLKRLRYALEFVSEIYERRTVKYLRHVVKLQDVLGLMQDARVAAGRLRELATAEGSTLSPSTVFVMGGVTERYRGESERLAHMVPKLLHELGGSEWRKLTTLMERRRLELGAQYRWPGPTASPPGIRVGAHPASTAPDHTPAPPPRPAPAEPRVAPSPDLPAPGLGAASLGAIEHPAASRQAPGRLAPTSWATDPVTGPDDRLSETRHPGERRPSSNGEGPHTEGPS